MLIRFAKKLGLSGYSELKARIRIERREAQPNVDGLLQAMTDSYHKMMEDLVKKNLTKLFEKLFAANRVFVYGSGSSQARAASEMKILPHEGKVVAPCEAEVTTLFDTKHAIGLTTRDGVELLIHVGINTVELGGKYYEVYVAEGDKVEPGQLLATFDMEGIQNAGYNMTTPVIVTNSDDYKMVEGAATGTVQRMEPLIKVEN
ncbi:MAG: glucose PTS transporter subunit IIA [Eubacterium sp.]|nr:glucose PTS transporter subunit IIA [Eubacterium sp.]